MTDTNATTAFTIESLNAAAARLRERADEIHQLSLAALRRDLLTAARCADLLAHVRFVLGEIMTTAMIDPVAVELIRGLLDEIERAEPTAGKP